MSSGLNKIPMGKMQAGDVREMAALREGPVFVRAGLAKTIAHRRQWL